VSEPTTEPFEEISAAPVGPRRRRSPLIDLVVSLFGVYLLVSMFGDFRYWARSSQPVELGHASELVARGLDEVPDQAFVVLRGTPDVQHAARLKQGERAVSYQRIIEGGGALFVAMERKSDQPHNQYEGVFAGRIRRLSGVRMLPWIRAFFDAEGIVQTVELGLESLLSGLPAAGGGGFTAIGVDGERYSLEAADPISVTVEHPDAQLQLGRSSFSSLAAAEAAVAALGVPYYKPTEQSSAAFYKLFARIPAAEREAAQRRLSAELAPASRPDASVGVALLPMRSTYVVAAEDLDRDGERVRIAVGGGAASLGYELAGERLVPRELVDGRLSVDAAAIRGVQLSRPVRVDERGFLIVVGEAPESQRLAAAMWFGVLAVVLWNLASLGWWWRRRRA